MVFPNKICHLTCKFRRIAFLPLFIFFFCSGNTAYPADNTITIQGKDTVYHLTHNDIKSGERLFYGLMRGQEDQASCISCHNIKPVQELNWNPSASEISAAAKTKSLDDLKAVLLTPAGKRLAQAHAAYASLTEDQLVRLKGYMTEFSEMQVRQHKPPIDKMLTFLAWLVIFLLAFLDLVWFRIVPFRWIHTIALLVTAVLLTRIIVEESIALGRSKNYAPDQPIKFSHAVHAGQNKIDCQFCHNSAEFAKSAGIPSASICINCHMIVREGSRSGRFEINKIFAALEQNKPISWKRVYNLPDHVFFSHAQHVGAGKLACNTCHGSVEQMDRIVQVPDLSMGWCINCHRDTKVQFHDNKFYEKYGDLRQKLEKGEIDSVTVSMVGGTDCMKCHY